MTIRHTFHVTVLHAAVLAATIALGCAVLPAPASAAQAAPTFAATGSDGLAGYANLALDQWVTYSATRRSGSLAQFSDLRDAVAAAAADRLGLDRAAMQAAWRNADSDHQVALLAAFTQLGTRYRRNAASPSIGFDCSGLTSWSWAQAGVQLPHQSRSQMKQVAAVTRATAQAGDLVYYPGHVMIYLGVGDAIIHSPFTGRNVEVALLPGGRSGSVRFGNPVG